MGHSRCIRMPVIWRVLSIQMARETAAYNFHTHSNLNSPQQSFKSNHESWWGQNPWKNPIFVAKLSSHQFFHNTSVLSLFTIIVVIIILCIIIIFFKENIPGANSQVFFGWKKIATVKPGGFTQKNRIFKTFLPLWLLLAGTIWLWHREKTMAPFAQRIGSMLRTSKSCKTLANKPLGRLSVVIGSWGAFLHAKKCIIITAISR